MRIQEHSNKLETNVQAETQDFGIGDASVVIEILRNRLYEHKIQTLVQEYICNARDAMRELGKGNNFEVTVPTMLSPVFKVRDFGPGISPDRMKDVFIKYGSSTKRGDNLQTGGFGIGAKSAWSYTDSFTVTTFIDGTKRVYVAHTGINNNGRLDQVSTVKTNEPNGTEIQVPVGKDDISEFRNAVFRAIYFWKEKPALKGELDVPALVSGYRLGDDLEVIDSKMIPDFVGSYHYGRNMLAVIDGVPYTINDKLFDKCKKLFQLQDLVNRKVILHMGNGVVEVSASRESIADSKLSIAALEKIAVKAIITIKTHLMEEFGKVTSNSEFFDTYKGLSFYFKTDKYAKHGGYEIDGDTVRSEKLKKIRLTDINNIGRRNRVTDKINKKEMNQNYSYLSVKNLSDLYFLKNEESAVKVNKRLREYFKAGKNTMILIEPLAGDMASFDQVVSDLGAKDFLSLTWTEEPKKERQPKVEREKEEFCAHTFDRHNRHEYLTLAGNAQKWFYVEMDGTSWGDYDPGHLRELSSHLKRVEDGARICGLSSKAVKMIQGDPNFLPLSAWLEKFKPTRKQVAFVKTLVSANSEIMKLVIELKDLKDAFLSDMVQEYKGIGKGGTESLPTMLQTRVEMTDELKEFKENDEKLSKILKSKYPMLADLSYYGHRYHDDIALYINAKHKAS
jgi:hypothetical protein